MIPDTDCRCAWVDPPGRTCDACYYARQRLLPKVRTPSPTSPCPECRGRRTVREWHSHDNYSREPCPACGGSGQR